jgi:hypothetical protein
MHEVRCKLVFCRSSGEGDIARYKNEVDRTVLGNSLRHVLEQGVTGHILGKLITTRSEMEIREVKPAQSIDQRICPR